MVVIEPTDVSAELSILERHLAVKRSVFFSQTVARWAGKNLTDDHMPAVAHVLTGNRDLSTLELARNRIGDEGARLIAQALPASDSLRTLWLTGNRVGDKGACALAEALPSLGWLGRGSSLEELWLSSNRIGDSGVRALAEALPRVPGLQKLDLRANRFGELGAVALSQALPLLYLDELYLQVHACMHPCVQALPHFHLDALWWPCGGPVLAPRTGTVLALHWQGNRIGDSGACALAEALPLCPWLHHLRLTGG